METEILPSETTLQFQAIVEIVNPMDDSKTFIKAEDVFTVIISTNRKTVEIQPVHKAAEVIEYTEFEGMIEQKQIKKIEETITV
ncbi:MAG: hypothetical protein V4665_03380 [Patescibacteria group bacterium]